MAEFEGELQEHAVKVNPQVGITDTDIKTAIGILTH